MGENPDAQLGLLAYLGFPVYWPDGDVFGTICVLNDKPRDFSQADRRLLLSARDAIHDALGAAADTAPLPDIEQGAASTEPARPWDYDPTQDRLRLSVSIRRRYDLPDADHWSLTQWLRCFPQDQRQPIVDGLAAIREGRAQTIGVAVVVPGLDTNALVRLTARGIQDGSDRLVAIVGTHSARSTTELSSTTEPSSPPDPLFSRPPYRAPDAGRAGVPRAASLEWQARRGGGAQVVMAIVEVANVGALVRSEGSIRSTG